MTTRFLDKQTLLTYLIIRDIQITQQDMQKAIQGEGATYSKIGDIYFARKDYIKAAGWHKLGAEQRNILSQQRMGWMFHHGKGVFANYILAMEYYLKAQKNGDLLSTNNIGFMYEMGQGVKRNYKTALKWYLQAANKGNCFALNNVGRFYENGLGVEVDEKCALKWYQKSANKGNEVANKEVKRLNRKGIFVNNEEKYLYLENEIAKETSQVISFKRKKDIIKQAIQAAENAIKSKKKEIRLLKIKSILPGF